MRWAAAVEPPAGPLRASAAPPVRFPNVYGIDMPAPSEFVAHERTEEEIGREIGADWLIYQRLDDLVQCAAEGNPEIKRFECSVFDGNYVTGDVDADYLARIAGARSDLAKAQRTLRGAEDVKPTADLHDHV